LPEFSQGRFVGVLGGQLIASEKPPPPLLEVESIDLSSSTEIVVEPAIDEIDAGIITRMGW